MYNKYIVFLKGGSMTPYHQPPSTMQVRPSLESSLHSVR